MESEYLLDFDKYYEIQMNQKLRRFERMLKAKVSEAEHVFGMQQTTLDALDYFLWGEYGKKLLKIFHERYPGAYQSCVSLHEKTSKIGFNHPKKVLDVAHAIKSHLIRYGARKNINIAYNNIWGHWNLARRINGTR